MGISLGKILTRSFIKSLYKSPIRSPIMSSYRSPNKLFFVVDVDNTLFSRRHKVMEYMDHRSIEYVKGKIDVMRGNSTFYIKNESIVDKIERLNKEYGNIFNGLSIENGIDIKVFDHADFISEGAAYNCIKPTPVELHELNILFESLKKTPNLKIWTFSNGSNKHVSDVLDILKIKDYFDGHINLTFMMDKYKKPIRKPSQQAYQIVEDEMKFDRNIDKIYFIDDHNPNIEASLKRKNWESILVDEKGTRMVKGALRIKSIYELKDKIPELFNGIK